MIWWVAVALGAPPAGLDLEDLDQWPLDRGLFDDADGCWQIGGRATFTDRVGPWSRRGSSRLQARFVDGRFEEVSWDHREVTYDTIDGSAAGVFDDRPIDISLYAERDDPADRQAMLATRQGRRIAKRLDRLGRSDGVVTTTAGWDEASGRVVVIESWPLGSGGNAPRIDRTLDFPGAATVAIRERWSLDGAKLFPGAPLTPALRLDVLEIDVERRADEPLPTREAVRYAVTRLGLNVAHEHVVTFEGATSCTPP